MWKRFFIFITFFNGLSFVYSEDDVLIKTRGQSVTLECPLDVNACGELHSVKWFKGNDRIAVVSGDGEVANVEGELQDRLTIDHSPSGPSTRLNIKNLQVSDDDTYLCESTYLEPLESCDTTGAYNIKLSIYVPPSSIVMLDESGHLIRNATKTKPLREGETLTKSCEVIGTRPTPTIGWYKNGERIQDTVTAEEIDGLFTVKSKFSLLLSRAEVNSHLECIVETPALGNIVSNYLLLDMEIRPTKIDLSGVEHHVVQGTKVLLQCDVQGARPAANTTFYNNSQIVIDGINGVSISRKVIEKNDGTFDTISQMIFTATRFENGASIRCEADNIVMRDDFERPLHDTLVLEVMYPPVVYVRPDNITTNETQDFLLFCEYDANPASLERVTWIKNGEILNTNQSRFEGGHLEQTALLVKGATRSDIGTYICELQNSIGSDASDNEINVDVQYVPTVEIDMEPDSPLIENNESNVTLYCNVLQGNPSTLLKVRWFLDGLLLKELPECDNNENDEDNLCEIDPSKMLLQNVGRDFHGNYSCEGFNGAGWGDVSNEAELVVYYEPGNASLAFYPPIPIKRKSVTFTCSVDDLGNPSATRYRWLRGNKPVMDVVTAQWTVDPVGLDSRTNFSCYAHNEGGDGNPTTILLDVHAPPAFIQKLHPYTGALHSAKNASLSCRVECVPTCSISWFKDGNGIEENDPHYAVKETLLPADPSTGDFESVLSILYFNITAWQSEKLDIFKDNANYSCVSTHNSVGTGVRSTTFFGVEYPPENVTVSNPEVMVEEGSLAQRILCSAKAYPEPSYTWIRNDEIIAKGNALLVNKPMQHADAGIYTCIAKNKHGNGSAVANINILFKPNCTIVRRELDDEDGLLCSAMGNPSAVDFAWSLKSENESLDASNAKQQDTSSSFLPLNDASIEVRTYVCVANNTVGKGTYCEIEVAGHIAWWQKWDRTTLYILIGVLILLLAVVIIVCLIIICICRNRRKRDKYHDKLYAPRTLTDPGEYENLPFHGLQNAPNKSACLTATNSSCTNVVRVAPRQKYQTTNKSSMISSSGQNINSSAQFPIQSFNYINYQSQAIPNTLDYDNIKKQRLDTTNSRTNPFLVKGSLNKCSDKKFNTLTKSLAVRKSPQFYSIRKCKRHNSYNGPILNTSGSTAISTSQNKLNSNLIDYEQPLYENLTDSIQIHEATLPNNDTATDPTIALIRFNNNSNYHHDSDTNSSGNNTNSNNNNSNSNKDQLSYISSNKERISIHRSDSGISNSSYEYLPQPTPRVNSSVGKQKLNAATASHSNVPVYMNLPYISCTSNLLHSNGQFHEINPSENNNFYTRPSNFLPKELFATSSSAVERKEPSTSLRRPIKLPLRKHHSFHFQPSQTVAGLIKQKRQQQNSKQNRHYSKEEVNISPASSAINYSLSKNENFDGIDKGPLVFKPYDENSAFIPIQPISQHLNKSMPNNIVLDSGCISSTSDSLSGNNHRYIDKSTSISSADDTKSSSSSNSSNDRGKLPRICGTSLKHHVFDDKFLEADTKSDSPKTKRLVYADLLATSKNTDNPVNNKVNCVPKPSRTQYATIQFPEVNI